MPESTHTLDLTPSPRILEVIAETDLQVHQCLAELIDNCFDELGRAREQNPSLIARVELQLPTAKQASHNSEIIVADNGRGMSPSQMEHALRAGSTNNAQFGTLGLFGMGFNVATARLGSIAEVRSGRKGENLWSVATIDIAEMQRLGTYSVPLRQEPKAPEESGTTITVRSLREEIVTALSRAKELGKIKTMLGRIYSYILRDPARYRFSGSEAVGGLGLALYLNGNEIRPILPCIWDPSRSVTYRGQEIAAFQQIDADLVPALACMSCGHWSMLNVETCPECDSSEVELRERRIWGWLGVQRFTDDSDFGISLIRQGRVIASQDKGLFNWEMDDGSVEREYPIEVGGGRIVGEIHLDHASVNFRKTDFDRSSRAWATMVAIVRGESPLRPNKAKELGLQENASPLGLLFNAYRRNDPGYRYLVPGNGQSALHTQSRVWAKLFQSGEPNYATDETWYEAIERHEEIKNGRHQPNAQADGAATTAWLDSAGLGHLAQQSADGGTAPDPVGPAASAPVETRDQRFSRYRKQAASLPELDGVVRIGRSNIILKCYATSGVDLSEEQQGGFFAIRVQGGEVEMFVDERHPLIASYGWAPANVALTCGADPLRKVLDFSGTIDEFILEVLRDRPDAKLDYQNVRSRAESQLDAIRERLRAQIGTSSRVYWDALSPGSKADAELTARSVAADIVWIQATSNGEFALYLTPTGIREIIENQPTLMLDGHVFSTTYAQWRDAAARSEQVEGIALLVGELGQMLKVGPRTRAIELQRHLQSVELLASQTIDV